MRRTLLSIRCNVSDARPNAYKNNYKEKDPDYGKTWMYFPDGDGNPCVVNLTEAPPQARSSSSESDVHFNLYTRRNKDVYSELVLDSAEEPSNTIETGPPFNDEYFDPKKEVKIVTHGWKSSGQSTTVLNIKDAYLENRDCNVIVVDWEDLASNIFYFIPAANTKIVGKKTGRLVEFLISQYGMIPEQFHIIGHSLGAHVSGYAGSNVKTAKIGRITGLDPASPGFEYWAGPEDRLDPEDAQFVDVVHTCAGVLGFYNPLGHADFYPNGGTPSQPGCGGLPELIEACSHARAHQFFAESIGRPRGFRARQCHDEQSARSGACEEPKDAISTLFMGDAVSSEAKGVFYLETNSGQPYARSLDAE